MHNQMLKVLKKDVICPNNSLNSWTHFQKKIEIEGSVERFNTRLVRGFTPTFWC